MDGAVVERVTVVDADGSGTQSLFTADSSELAGLAVEGWAPDGSSVLISGYHQTWPASPNTLGYFRVPLTGGPPVELPGVVAVSVSPAGDRVFAARPYGAGVDLLRLSPDLATSTLVHTFPDAFPDWYPQLGWSADGSRLGALGVTRQRDWSFLVLDRDGGLVEEVAELPHEHSMAFSTPRLSPDGTVLSMYAATAEGRYDLEGVYLHDLVRGRTCLVTDIYEHGGGLWATFAHDGGTLLIHGSRLRTLDISSPGNRVRTTSVPDLAWVDGVLGSVTPEMAAEPCARERIVRDVGLQPGRRAGKAVLRAYVSGVPACENKVPVRLQRRRDGKWRTVATDTTDRAHTAVFRRPGRGTFRALAPRVVRDDYACLKATSARWTARPPLPADRATGGPASARPPQERDGARLDSDHGRRGGTARSRALRTDGRGAR